MRYFDENRCSFCGKKQEEVKKFIAGYDAYICNECVDMCNEILDNETFNKRNKLNA